MYGQGAMLFVKEVPGAELTFQPEDLDDYSDDEWDIRVTIADMPLDEGFYITVNDPNAVNQTIEALLDEYVLSQAHRQELAVDDNPDLPFIQDELIQYFDSWRQGKLKLEFYINKNPSPGPIQLYQRAKGFLSTCVYDDGEWDYRVLDLVIVPSVPEQSSYEKANQKRNNSDMFLLQLFKFHMDRGADNFLTFCRQAPIAYYLGASCSNSSTELYSELNNLYRKGFLKRDMASSPDSETGARYTTGLTTQAEELVQAWQKEVADARDYDCFAAVSAAPPALGVPDGFDARVQMMEYDGLDIFRTVLLLVIDENREEFFDLDHWIDAYESGEFLKIVNDAMAYKTNFLSDVLDDLKRLADENASF